MARCWKMREKKKKGGSRAWLTEIHMCGFFCVGQEQVYQGDGRRWEKAIHTSETRQKESWLYGVEEQIHKYLYKHKLLHINEH